MLNWLESSEITKTASMSSKNLVQSFAMLQQKEQAAGRIPPIEKDYKKMSDELEAILSAKTAEKSQAALLLQRSLTESNDGDESAG